MTACAAAAAAASRGHGGPVAAGVDGCARLSDVADLETRLREQARACRSYGSALTGALLEGAADDLAAGGVVADLIGPHADQPAGSVPALRLAGALHRLVLEGVAPELAQHYPSVGGAADVEKVWPAAAQTCVEHLARLRELVARPVQTNEVGRSAVLYGVLLHVPEPVHLLELGASAGLNLRCDSFRYDVHDTVLGDPDSPVRLEQPWHGAWPAPRPLEVRARRGCDPNPLDPTTEEGRLTLTSYVWADQPERLARLRGALDLAARVPATVERAGALEFLQRELPCRPDDAATVVWHSVVWQYVDPDERSAVDALLEQVGAQATEAAPLVRASMEPERVDAGRWVFRVRLRRWPDGGTVHLADAQGHGPPVTWVAPAQRESDPVRP